MDVGKRDVTFSTPLLESDFEEKAVLRVKTSTLREFVDAFGENNEPVALFSKLTLGQTLVANQERKDILDLIHQLKGTLNAVLDADIDRVNSAATAPIAFELSKLPLGMLQDLNKFGVKFIAVNNSVAEVFPALANAEDYGGYFDTDSRKAVIVHGPTISYNAVLHETGHAIEYMYGNARLDPRFQQAYEADKHTLLSYFRQPGDTGPQEAYPECWRVFSVATRRCKV